MAITTISPAEARRAIEDGALLVDIRGTDEHAREWIPGAVNVPLDKIGTLSCDGRPVIFHCRSGMRTAAGAAELECAAGAAPCYILEGGLQAWHAADQPVAVDRHRPLEVMRQGQLAAGGLVVAGVALGAFVAPGFYLLSAFVGAGLMTAGATGWCGMAKLLAAMPWNRRAAA